MKNILFRIFWLSLLPVTESYRNLAVRFMSDVQLAEVRAFYGFQIARKIFIQKCVRCLLKPISKTKRKKTSCLTQLTTSRVSKRRQIGRSNGQAISVHRSPRDSCICCVEGIFFGGLCSIYWLKKRGLMPGPLLATNLSRVMRHAYRVCCLALQHAKQETQKRASP